MIVVGPELSSPSKAMMQSSGGSSQRDPVTQIRFPGALEAPAADSARFSGHGPTDSCRQQPLDNSTRGVKSISTPAYPAWTFGSGKPLKPDDLVLCPSSTQGVPLETILEEPSIDVERAAMEKASRSVSRDVTPEYRPGFQDYTTTLNGAIARTLLRSGGGYTRRV